MDRTLYLRESNGLAVRRDGPSLWITEPGKAGRRVPVRIVSRVILMGNLKIDTDTIALFAERGVPVLFAGLNGKIQAAALPHDVSPSDLHDRQRTLAEDDVLRARAEEWLAAGRTNCRLEMLRTIVPALAREFESLGLRDRDYKRAIQVLLPMYSRIDDLVGDMAKTLLHELVLHALGDSDLDPHEGILHRRKNYGLCKDFICVLDSEVDRQMIQVFRDIRPAGRIGNIERSIILQKEINRKMICNFEDNRARLTESINRLIDDYHRLLRWIE